MLARNSSRSRVAAGSRGDTTRLARTILSATSCSSWSILTIKPFDATVQDGTVLVQNFVSLTQDANDDDVADFATNVRKLGLFEGVDQYRPRHTHAWHSRSRNNLHRHDVAQ